MSLENLGCWRTGVLKYFLYFSLQRIECQPNNLSAYPKHSNNYLSPYMFFKSQIGFLASRLWVVVFCARNRLRNSKLGVGASSSFMWEKPAHWFLGKIPSRHCIIFIYSLQVWFATSENTVCICKQGATRKPMHIFALGQLLPSNCLKPFSLLCVK